MVLWDSGKIEHCKASKNSLSKIIDNNKDSLRFYLLGKNWENRVEQMGKNDTYHPTDDVMLI